MWTSAAGLGGLAVAVLIWRFALALVPDAHGRALAALPVGRRRGAMLATVAGGAVGAGAVAAVLPERPAAVALALFAAVSPGLVVIDVVGRRLPFIITGSLGSALAICFGWDVTWPGAFGSLTRAGWAALVVGALALAWWRVFDGGAGLGDVVLLAVIAAFAGWLSWVAVWAAITAGFVMAAVAAGVTRWRTGNVGTYLPLGPFLLAGWWAAFALYSADWIN